MIVSKLVIESSGPDPILDLEYLKEVQCPTPARVQRTQRETQGDVVRSRRPSGRSRQGARRRASCAEDTSPAAGLHQCRLTGVSRL